MSVTSPLDPSLWDDAIPVAEDFYHHVNRRWLDANPVPPEYPMWGAYLQLDHDNKELTRELLEAAVAAGPDADRITRLAGAFYASGMDEAAIAAAGTTPLRRILDRIDAVDTLDDFRAAHLELNTLGLAPVFGFGVEADFEDGTRYLGYLVGTGLALPERGYYLNDDERSVGLRAAYRSHTVNQFRNLGSSEADAEATADALLAFETRLAEHHYTPEEKRDPRRTMNRHRVDELDGLVPSLRLGSYVRELGIPDETMSVDNPAFFRALEAILAETPVATLRDVLRWHVLRATASSLAPVFDDEHFAFFGRILGGQQEQQPRWKRIVNAASSDIGEAVGQLFVRHTFPPEAKTRVEHLVEHLFAAMRRAIEGNDWMTDATRAQALEKLAGFRYKIGYPDSWKDYSTLELDRGDYLGNRLAASAFEMRLSLAKLGTALDTEEWAMPPHIVNAYYHPLRNEIVFPAGILRPPFFYADADDPVNYGSIGTVIGHEITHGFDDAGSRFDAKGALRDWWTAEDRAEFDRRAAVIAAQFGGFEILEGVQVNGQLTLGENIADLGGIAIALDAMHEALHGDDPRTDGLTADQRFFLAYATMWRMGYTEAYARLLATIDNHAPSRYRVNGPLSNTPAFAAAFGVPEGSPMARPADDRAKIW